MSIFSKLKASWGKSGTPLMDLALDGSSFAQGEVLQGEVRLRGGKNTQRVNKVTISFVEEWQQGWDEEKGHHKRRILLDKIEVASRLDLKKDESKIIPFRYELSANLPVSHEYRTYFLHARAEIPLAADIQKSLKVAIRPSDAISIVQEALAWKMGFSISGIESAREHQVFKFKPGPATPEEFRRIEQVEMVFYNDSEVLRMQIKVKVDILLWLDSDNYFSMAVPYREILAKDKAAAYDVIAERVACRLRQAMQPVDSSNIVC